MKHRRVYQMLVEKGHSAEHAMLILLDARRGQQWALWWIRTLRRH